MEKVLSQKKSIIYIGCFVLAGIFLSTLLMSASYLFPTGNIKEHVAENAPLFEFEGDYPSLSTHISSKLDNITDSLMLHKAAFKGSGISPIQKAMMVYSVDNGSYILSLDEVLTESDSPEQLSSYGRYWHGYLFFLKPMLWLFSYREIRMINLYLQSMLVAVICLSMFKRGLRNYIPSFLLLILMQSPITTSMSLQNSTVYYIYLVSSLIIILFYEKMQSSGLLVYLFVFIGGITSFLDLLTYPLVSFGIPYIFCLIKDSKKCSYKFFIQMLAAWGIGYCGIWAGKWIVGSLLTGENIIADAVQAAENRTSGSFRDVHISYWLILFNNAKEIIKNPASIIVLAAFLIILIVGIFSGKVKNIFVSRSVLLLTALLPLLWYAVLNNHSYIHSTLFTWREFLITGFAVSCWVTAVLPSIVTNPSFKFIKIE